MDFDDVVWTDQKSVSKFLDDQYRSYSEEGYGRNFPRNVLDHWMRYDLTAEMALEWLGGRRRRHEDERTFTECMTVIYYKIETHDQRVAVMNKPRLFCMLSWNYRRDMAREVIVNGDFSRLGVEWITCFEHLDDIMQVHDLKLRERFHRTHSVECIEQLGDKSAEEADAELSGRIAKRMEPDADFSVRTAEFLSKANMATNLATPRHEAVILASELIQELVGYETRWLKNIGWLMRTVHTKLATLHTLLDIITNMMTPKNAGVVMRWVLTAKHRHHEEVWKKMTDAMNCHHWRIGKVVFVDGELGVEWRARDKTLCVVPADGQSQIGELQLDKLAMVPGVREFGTPIKVEANRTIWRAPIHPLRGPSQAMLADPTICPV